MYNILIVYNTWLVTRSQFINNILSYVAPWEYNRALDEAVDAVLVDLWRIFYVRGAVRKKDNRRC